MVNLKAGRMGHSVKASLWCDSVLISTRFRLLYFRMSNYCIWCYIWTNSSQTTQGGYQIIIILPIKSKMAAGKNPCFLRFLYWTESSSTVTQSPRLTNDYKFDSSEIHISSRPSSLSFVHHFVIYWLFQNDSNKNQHQKSYQRETIPDKFVFFPKLVSQKSQ